MFTKDNKLILQSFLFLLASDWVEYMSGPARLGFNGTYVTAILKLLSVWKMLQVVKKSKWSKDIPGVAYTVFCVMFAWNIITFIRGAASANDYWDWKYLIMTASFSFLIPFAVVVGIKFDRCVLLLRFVLKKLFVYGFFLLPPSIIFRNLWYTRTMFPVSLFLTFSVYMKKKWLYLILAVAAVSIIAGYELRANILRIIIPILLMMAYYFRAFVTKGIMRLICMAFLVVPFVLLFLGITGSFNIFKPQGEESSIAATANAEDLEADTRTMLYTEVFESMSKHASFLLGEGATAKYESASFNFLDDDRGRYGAEVGFLNTLLYSGIVGVLLYFFILLTACYYGINHSHNFLCKMLAVFTASRWLMFFLEDITKYDLNFYFLWIAVALCLSYRFRSLTDKEIKSFFTLIVSDIDLKRFYLLFRI